MKKWRIKLWVKVSILYFEGGRSNVLPWRGKDAATTDSPVGGEQDVGRGAQIDYFISTLEELNALVTEFDEQLWISMVDHKISPYKKMSPLGHIVERCGESCW